MEMSEMDIYRAAWLVLARQDPDAFVAERLASLADDLDGTAAWHRIAAAMEALRVEAPANGRHVQ